MNYTEIFLLALALSIDAGTVSFSYGLVFNRDRVKNSLLLSSFTGLFQGLMPLLGYILAGHIKTFIAPYASFVVFLIFTFLGIKFIKESFSKKRAVPSFIDCSSLFLIGIATSIDAFSAGISLSLSGNDIIIPAILIALITFINSNIGFSIGGKLKNFPSRGLEIFAGLILIILGIKAIL